MIDSRLLTETLPWPRGRLTGQWWSLSSARAGWSSLQGPSHLEPETGVTPLLDLLPYGAKSHDDGTERNWDGCSWAVGFSPHALVWVARLEPLSAGEDEEAPGLSIREHLCRGLSSVLTASSLTPASGAAGEAAEHRVLFSSSLSSRTGELNTSLASCNASLFILSSRTGQLNTILASCNASSLISSSRPRSPTLSGLSQAPRRGEGVEA